MTTSVSNERSFSELKTIRIRLRLTMKQSRDLKMSFISTEIDVDKNLKEIVNKYVLTSSVLQKHLMFN